MAAERAPPQHETDCNCRSVNFKSKYFESLKSAYQLQEPHGWGFFVSGLDNVACIPFDEAVEIFGKEYVVADKPMIHHSPGSPISRPGPQKMAGEKIIYQLSANANYQKNVYVGFSYAGCVHTLSSGQVLSSAAEVKQ